MTLITEPPLNTISLDQVSAGMAPLEEHFDLPTLLDHLVQLHSPKVDQIPLSELNWILGGFVLSGGQQLPLNQHAWPSPTERESIGQFANYYLPLAAAPDFPAVANIQLRGLALAAAVLGLYVLLLDSVIDKPATTPAAVKLALHHLMLQAHQELSQIFPPNHPFWPEMEGNLTLMSQSMLDECQLYGGTANPFSLDEFKRVACGKMAFVRLNYIALAMLNGTPQEIPALNKCWDAIGLAVIVFDDVLDWREDYENENYTYLLSQILFSTPFQTEVAAGKLPKTTEVGMALFCTDQIESLYALAADELTAAVKLASEINCTALAGLIDELREKAVALRNNLVSQKINALFAMSTNNG
jgi:hypothetical protein